MLQSNDETLQSIEGRAPAVVEAHFLLLFTILLRRMNNVKSEIGFIPISFK